MKVYELLSFNKELLLKIHIAGLKVDDYKYLIYMPTTCT